MLQGLSGEAGDARPALPGIVQTYLRAGDVAGARTYLAGVVEETPDDPLPRLMLAGVTALAGDAPAAEAAYRQLVADRPDYAPAYQGLYLLLAATGQAEAARATLEQGLAATDGDPRLLFVQAGQLEAEGDFDAAIAVYERLYAQDTASEIIANNLASLLSSHRADRREPGARLHHRPPAAQRRGAALPGHLRLDPGAARRRRGGAAAPRARRRRAAAGAPGALPPRRRPARPRAAGGAPEPRAGAGRRRPRDPGGGDGRGPEPARADQERAAASARPRARPAPARP